MKILKLTIFFLSLNFFAFGQGYNNNEGTILAVNFSFGGAVPAADLADRFGYFSNIGGGLQLMTKKNWIVGADMKFMYGRRVNELTILNLFNDEGFIFGDGGAPASVQLRQRGLYFGGEIGKLISFVSGNPRSGFRITVGAGFFQHKIRIQNDPTANVSLLSGNYVEGYDRLTNGFALTQFIGYQHISKNRRVNLTIGFDFMQGFTQNRRNLNFDTRMKDETKRRDLLNGFRITWSLPFYLNDDGSEVFY